MLQMAMTGFVAVAVEPEATPMPPITDGNLAASLPLTTMPVADGERVAPPSPTTCQGLFDVKLPTAVRLQFGADVDGQALQRVLAALAAP